MGFFKSFSKTTLSAQSDRTYLDFASSTPLDQRMLADFPIISTMALQANPSALHKEGLVAKKVLRDAHELVATTLSAHVDEIIFTSNATESDNLALQGTVRGLLAKNIQPNQIAIITTDTEHTAVLETVAVLAKEITVTILPTEQGIIDPKQIILPEEILAAIVSVMHVNNEIGVVQPIYEIAKRVRFLRKHNPSVEIYLHIDATQAPLHFSLNVQKLGVDMMTLGATKLYCPKGVGMLYVKRGTPITPIMYGGGQQHGLRPGTEPIQLIHDFAHSLTFAQKDVESYSQSIADIQRYTEDLISKEIPQATITAVQHERTPHITHIALKDFDSELMVLELDARGFAVSAKSACKNEDNDESGIVERIYGQGWGAVRISYGRSTTKNEVKNFIHALKEILIKYKK
ncbi:MAG: aminotransferase class V-fold PLP-dependent enzyme [Candidatus Paceibacterota bacterium]